MIKKKKKKKCKTSGLKLKYAIFFNISRVSKIPHRKTNSQKEMEQTHTYIHTDQGWCGPEIVFVFVNFILTVFLFHFLRFFYYANSNGDDTLLHIHFVHSFIYNHSLLPQWLQWQFDERAIFFLLLLLPLCFSLPLSQVFNSRK